MAITKNLDPPENMTLYERIRYSRRIQKMKDSGSHFIEDDRDFILATDDYRVLIAYEKMTKKLWDSQKAI